MLIRHDWREEGNCTYKTDEDSMVIDYLWYVAMGEKINILISKITLPLSE